MDKFLKISDLVMYFHKEPNKIKFIQL